MSRTPFDRMLESTLYVATDRAVREGRPMKVCRHERLGWTVVPAEKRCEPGYEPLVAVGPGDHTDAARRKIVDLISREHPMGAAKRVYTARQTRQPVAAGVLRAFGGAPGHPEPKRAGDDLPGAITSHELAQRYGTAGDPAPPWLDDGPATPTGTVGAIPSEIQSPDDYCTLCGGPHMPCVGLCAKALANGQRVLVAVSRRRPMPGSGVSVETHTRSESPSPDVTIAPEPPTLAADASVPSSGPYPPSPSATRHKRSQKVPAKGQKSLFD